MNGGNGTSDLHFEFQFNPLTCTRQEDLTYVPWISASDLYRSTPEDAPIPEEHLYYENLFPALFDEMGRRFFLGSAFDPRVGHSSYIRGFWLEPETCQRGKVAVIFGERKKDGFVAPIAAYHLRIPGVSQTRVLLIQHGSYQILEHESQPEILDGFVHLYRGIGESECFNFLRYERQQFSDIEERCLGTYYDAQEASFSNSEISFADAHSLVFRDETKHFLHPPLWRWGICHEEIWNHPMTKLLRSFAQQQFSLRPILAKNKFGPNFVKVRTPLHNLRMTSFFAGEEEVRIIDPNLLDLVETTGCRARTISMTEASRAWSAGSPLALRYF